MNKLRQCETKKLHYGKYLHKLVLYNRLSTIFRTEYQKDGKLGHAKTCLEEYTQLYNAKEKLTKVRFRTTVEIPNEHYLDALDVYHELLDADDYKVRVDPWGSMMIYSNDKECLENIANKMRVSAKEIWSPSPSIEKLLTQKENIIVVDNPVDFPYRITLNRARQGTTAELANWLTANTNKSKIGKRALKELSNNGWVDGLYFHLRDRKVLILVEMMVGNKIRRIDKLVYKGDIDKY